MTKLISISREFSVPKDRTQSIIRMALVSSSAHLDRMSLNCVWRKRRGKSVPTYWPTMKKTIRAFGIRSQARSQAAVRMVMNRKPLTSFRWRRAICTNVCSASWCSRWWNIHKARSNFGSWRISYRHNSSIFYRTWRRSTISSMSWCSTNGHDGCINKRRNNESFGATKFYSSTFSSHWMWKR